MLGVTKSIFVEYVGCNVGVKVGNGVDVTVGVRVGVLLGGSVGVINTKLDCGVKEDTSVDLLIVEALTMKSVGVALSSRVGANVFGKSVYSCTNTGPSPTETWVGKHAARIVDIIIPMSGRIPMYKPQVLI